MTAFDATSVSVPKPPAVKGAAVADRWLIATAAPAVIVPALLAYNVPPSATFLNQAAALIGWGGFAVALSSAATATTRSPDSFGRPAVHGLNALFAALLLLALAAAGSALASGLPWSLALSTIGTVAAALVVTAAAAGAARDGRAEPAFRAFCIALVLAGGLSTAVAVVQVFVPSWANGDLVAAASVPGRASGNLRQPNHLSSLLLWSVIAALWLGEAGRLRRPLVGVLWAAFVFALVLSGSRTGTVGVVILGAWGVLDSRLSRGTRLLLLLSPVLYGVCLLGLTAWAHHGHAALVDERRFSGDGDISASRFRIWANTLALIARHPWFGVGTGEFNFAWSLTPFPGRPVAFFDHTHNLPLQFAVELGLPLAAAVIAALAYALWRAFAATRRHAVDPGQAVLLRAAFMMVLMIALHSQLEYPLWYAYFLLPTAFAFGLCLGSDGRAGSPATPLSPLPPTPGRPADALARRGPRPLVVAGLLLVGGGALAVFDYARVVAIFQAGTEADPLAARIARGQRSWFFSHHADYAAATTERASDAAGTATAAALAPFGGATHYLLDTRLMIAWADALNAAGDTERARHLAQRLREFHNPDAADYFEPCDDAADAAPATGQSLPYQCAPPTRAFDYRDFLAGP